MAALLGDLVVIGVVGFVVVAGLSLFRGDLEHAT